MSVSLNHTLVSARDPEASAAFLVRILGLAPPGHFAHFVTVMLANGVSLDYDEADVVHPQHYAFLVTEEDFDVIFDRVRAEQVTFFADPAHRNPSEINHRDQGRGLYFLDPDGHSLEVLTRPYGSGA